MEALHPKLWKVVCLLHHLVGQLMQPQGGLGGIQSTEQTKALELVEFLQKVRGIRGVGAWLCHRRHASQAHHPSAVRSIGWDQN